MSPLKALAFILLYVPVSLVVGAEMSLASTKVEAKKRVAVARPSHQVNSKLNPKLNAKLGTSFKFDGSSLRGKYQSSMGTAVAVENDKYLDDLLSGRKHFNDRLQGDNNRN